MEFCHIAPTELLSLSMSKSTLNLVLAHQVEKDYLYTAIYKDNKFGPLGETTTTIMDNSGFEFYKEHGPGYVFEGKKLTKLAKNVGADYIVLPDFPGETSSKTKDEAKKFAPIFKDEGYGTFFVPQGRPGELQEFIDCFEYAVSNPDIDYIGISILAVPIAYGVEQGNKLQRYLSRFEMMKQLNNRGLLRKAQTNNKKIHFLGMVDGPNEISLCSQFSQYIDSWDSSAAVWAGLNHIKFDSSPTGLLNGKLETPVDFNFKIADDPRFAMHLYDIIYNCDYINKLVDNSNWSDE